MYFKGMQKTSFIDYPGKIATVLFTGGCNFKCPFCHNGHLVMNNCEIISETEIFSHLEKRKGIIEAIVISGGEPTIFGQELILFMEEIRTLGFLIKLDTNGTNPEILEEIINKQLVDYIAMDIKAPLAKYEQVAGVHVDTDAIWQSIQLLAQSNIDSEFRTTVCNELLTKEDILQIADMIKSFPKKYFLQNYVDGENVLAGKGHFTPVDYLKSVKEENPFVIIR